MKKTTGRKTIKIRRGILWYSKNTDQHFKARWILTSSSIPTFLLHLYYIAVGLLFFIWLFSYLVQTGMQYIQCVKCSMTRDWRNIAQRGPLAPIWVTLVLMIPHDTSYVLCIMKACSQAAFSVKAGLPSAWKEIYSRVWMWSALKSFPETCAVFWLQLRMP